MFVSHETKANYILMNYGLFMDFLWNGYGFRILMNMYTNLPKVFVQHKITLVVNVPLWTYIKSGAMMGIEIYKYRKHTVLALSLVKI